MKEEAGSREIVKHIEKSNQLFIEKMFIKDKIEVRSRVGGVQ